MALTDEYIIPLIKQINTKRFFNTERGYQGQLMVLLDRLMQEQKIFPEKTIIEQEHQKTKKHHGIAQRPDIIVHIPIEEGVTDDRTENNFFVIALKLNGNAKAANDDFKKLDDMFTQLNYPEGVWINIGAYPKVFLADYEGEYQDRIHELSIAIHEEEIQIGHSKFENGKVITNDY